MLSRKQSNVRKQTGKVTANINFSSNLLKSVDFPTLVQYNTFRPSVSINLYIKSEAKTMENEKVTPGGRKRTVNINDRRVRKTNRILREKLISLLEYKDINEITVKELTEAADINRSTFYFYYEDVYDMVRQMQNEIYDVFYETVIRSDEEVEGAAAYVLYIKRFLDFCKKNEMQCKFVLKNDVNNELMNRIKNAVRQHIPDSSKVFSLTSPARYLTTFAVSGIAGVVVEWIEEGMIVSTTDMAEFITATYVLGAQETKKTEEN